MKELDNLDSNKMNSIIYNHIREYENSYLYNFIYTLYFQIFNKFPIIYLPDYTNEGYVIEDSKTKKKVIDLRDYCEYVEELKLVLASNSIYNYKFNIDNITTDIFIAKNWIIAINSYTTIYIAVESLPKVSEVLNLLNNVEFTEKKSDPNVYYITASSFGFESNSFKLKDNFNIDISKNYNSDLPYEELKEFCNKNSCGLTLFYGKPGTGKTSLIKNLINDCPETSFYLLDSSLLSNINDSRFLSYLKSKTNSVFILEDCEKVLVDRNTDINPWIGTLLNLTDGMLGEALSIKFICTFNADISSIDKAILREGRLNICYEFNPLEEDKAKVLCEELQVPYKNNMTLAEIYKHKKDISKLNKPNKIGF